MKWVPGEKREFDYERPIRWISAEERRARDRRDQENRGIWLSRNVNDPTADLAIDRAMAEEKLNCKKYDWNRVRFLGELSEILKEDPHA